VTSFCFFFPFSSFFLPHPFHPRDSTRTDNSRPGARERIDAFVILFWIPPVPRSGLFFSPFFFLLFFHSSDKGLAKEHKVAKGKSVVYVERNLLVEFSSSPPPFFFFFFPLFLFPPFFPRLKTQMKEDKKPLLPQATRGALPERRSFLLFLFPSW